MRNTSLKLPYRKGPIQISQTRHADSWRRHLLTVAVLTVVGPMLTGAASQVPIRHLIGSTWGYQKLKTSVNSNSKITCLAMAEKIWQIFHGRNPHTQCCCSSHKYMFLKNGEPFERKLNRLSTGIRCIAKKHCYHREIIYQTLISLLSVLNLYNLSINRYHWWTSSKMAGILKICLI